MNRKIIASTIMAFSMLFLSACGNQQVSKANSKDQSVSKSIQTTIIGGRTGGAWSVFTEGIAESIRRENKNSVITVEPGSIVENPPTVGTNKIPYGLSYAMTAYAAYSGEEPYKQPFKDIRAISVVIPANYYQFLVKANSKYDSLDEMIKDKAPIRLSVDQKGSVGEIITRNILKQHGVTYDDIVSWGGSVDHLDDEKTFELMADNRLDGTGDALSVPSSDIVEASTTMDLKLLSLDQETIKAVSESLGMEQGTIKAGSYDFLKKDIHTLSTPVILIVNKDVPDDEVYRITKSIYNSFDYLRTVHEEFKNLTDKNMMNVGKIPLHPGAVKFYKEKGLVK